jgi:hypothetical protein
MIQETLFQILSFVGFLSFLFFLRYYFHQKKKEELKKQEEMLKTAVESVKNEGSVSSEVAVAIGMALSLMQQEEYHDIENTVLTIGKVSRIYSPWSSKIYGLTKNPRSNF